MSSQVVPRTDSGGSHAKPLTAATKPSLGKPRPPTAPISSDGDAGERESETKTENAALEHAATTSTSPHTHAYPLISEVEEGTQAVESLFARMEEKEKVQLKTLKAQVRARGEEFPDEVTLVRALRQTLENVRKAVDLYINYAK